MAPPLKATTPWGERLYVNPMENVLIGSANIMRYLGIKSIVTLYSYVELYGLPAIKRPDGMWMTTMTAIDQWLWLAAEIDNENRPHSRGTNARAEIAMRRLKKTIEEGVGACGPKPFKRDGPLITDVPLTPTMESTDGD